MPSGIPTSKQKQDEAIIGTNDYSIVSKRSVEKIYYPEEPQFFEPFIGKFKRRAPLINRGYWLRMQAIEQVVLQFLDEKSEKKKVIVNLGCGYEPLPFRMLWKYGSKCRTVRFVDVDYPQLIQKKVEVIRNNAIYSDLLTQPLHHEPGSSVLLNDGRYCAVGCDLGDTKLLDFIFRTELQLNDSLVLFIGEVSIVYMDVKQADQLINLCGTLADARFCLLEQHLPEGSCHPFAKTMIEHFQKQTPLRCLNSYNTIESQNARFLSAGWRDVKNKDLWSLWQDRNFATTERVAMESVEPFDEWEELALFGGHYFLLMATTSSSHLNHISEHTIAYEIPYNISPAVEVHSFPNPPSEGLRRFGASFQVNDDTIAFHGGLKSLPQQGGCDVYTQSTQNQPPQPIPPAISCHTITKFGSSDILLVGGRNSPSKASPTCFLHSDSTWTPTQELTPGRYRHCSAAVTLDSTPGVLTFGGKTSDGRVLDDWTLFTPTTGWQKVEVSGPHPPPLFGASMVITGNTTGLLVGGMSEGGFLHAHFTTWEVIKSEQGGFAMKFESKLPRLNQVGIPSPATMRFGASLVQSRWGILLVGGIGPRGPIPFSEEVVVLRKYGRIDKFECLFDPELSRPLLIGCGAVTVEGGNVLVVGGSAVCFSFGAFWNDKSHLFCPKEDRSESPEWRLVDVS